MPCQKCDSVQSYKLSGNYNLNILPPRGHCFTKLVKSLESKNIKYQIDKDQIISIDSNEHEISGLSRVFEAALNEVELEDTKAVLLPLNRDKTFFNALSNTSSLKTVIGMCSSQWLTEIIENKKLTTHCQPILDSQELKPMGFECLLRGETGTDVVSPNVLFNAAKKSEMMFLLDKNARLTHISNINKISTKDKKVFINFNPTAIYDPLYCLSTTNKALKDTKIEPSQIVFEVIESDEVRDKAHLLKIINFYREQGYGVALDDLGSGYSSLNLLTELEPDYIKLDQHLVSDIHKTEIKQVLMEKICEMAQKLNIKVICEGIESEDELSVVKRFDVDYYQGYLFKKPMPYQHLDSYLEQFNER